MGCEDDSQPTAVPHDTSVNVYLPHGTLDLFEQLRRAVENGFSERDELGRATATWFNKHAAAQRAFFEHLIIIEGGTFALSLTYVAALGRLGARGIPLVWLRTGWIGLYCSMFCAFAYLWMASGTQSTIELVPLIQQAHRRDRAIADQLSAFLKLFRGATVKRPDSSAEQLLPEDIGTAQSHLRRAGGDRHQQIEKETKLALLKLRCSAWIAGASVIAAIVAFGAVGYFALQAAPYLLGR